MDKKKKKETEVYHVIRKHRFSLDQVFPHKNIQKECYEEGSHLVQPAPEGHTICIFAYGHTGSEKKEVPGEDRGVIPRAVHQLYDVVQKAKENNWHYKMVRQFHEIYNESIRDLLDSLAHVHTMLKKTSHNRAIAATSINERSSHSHSGLILRIQGRDSATGETTEGLLNLVDLAGSERLNISGSTRDGLRETQSVSKRLSCPGDVIANMHAPYRSSKFTYLLKYSLGEHSKTLVFLDVSPLADYFNEALCSLRFAIKKGESL
ncbi:P-loop containing nucleoside triphosphate hydrolase protein [Spinellus fusiger]|nr:P-loop containing nucleoside triphosphate hydrolase protein [Spinellus fusiger]